MLASLTRPETAAASGGSVWYGLPWGARVYVAAVVAGGAGTLAAFFPRTLPDAGLFLLLLIASCATSTWKVNLPIPLASGSTLSVSYAADLMALLLLGPSPAVVIAVLGVWTQCTVRVKKAYPLHRTLFSMAAEAITMGATGVVYIRLGGPIPPLELAPLVKPLVAAIATYFVVNTALVAGAIALTSERTWWRVWRDDFLWSSASFMVAGSAGAAAAFVIARGESWKALLLIAPVYLTYRTYHVFVGRLEDQKRHTAETQRLHRETVDALMQARRAEQALAGEKERLAGMVVELTRLEEARRQLLERERGARAAAEEASRLKDQFLAIVSHELRTPLNAIMGWADMLRTGMLPPADCERAYQTIFANSKRQAQLIDELLDVARISTGKLKLDRSAVDLTRVLGDAIDVVAAAADAKGVTLTVIVPQGLGLVYGDAARLQQVAWNLLTNAVKFTPEGGTVRVGIRRVGSAAELFVTDTGVGIPPEFLNHVFEPFRQADATTTRRYGGLGLGLSIVKSLVEAHGGTITAQSDGDGLGSTFTVRLPIISVVEKPGQGPDHSASAWPQEGAGAPMLDGVVVLVVDDDPESRDVVAGSLATRRAIVRTAGSAAEAYEFLQQHRVDVLLADVGMPDEDGYTLIRKVRRHPGSCAAVPAAALTALARDEDREQALEAGFQLHLSKPIDSAALIDAVASLRSLSAVI